MTELLKVNNLATHFKTESGLVKAVDGVSYYIDKQVPEWQLLKRTIDFFTKWYFISTIFSFKMEPGLQ
jgi:hypothetical protein